MPGAILETKQLTKQFGAFTAVKSLSFQVQPGEIFGFLGPNGAGKTTTIHMICGLLKPDHGQIWINGAPANGWDPSVRSQIGFLPQASIFWNRLTCREQLQFMGKMYGMHAAEARKAGDRLLEILGLAEKSNQQARRLSGGMQRRLSLALALVHDPQLIILDEPEAGLDPQSRVKVREFIKSLAPEKTILLTTHNMDEADRLADRIAIIDHGEMLVLDSPEALKSHLGTGDVLEMAYKPGTTSASLQKVHSALAKLPGVTVLETTAESLSLQAFEVMKQIPDILEICKSCSIPVSGIHLHENTLEDVFIKLTGRRLRE